LNPCGVLDLDPQDRFWRIDDEVNLHPGPGPPVIERTAGLTVVKPCTEMLTDKSLKCVAIDLLRAIQRTARPERAIHAGVESVELGVSHKRPLGSLSEYREAISKQQVFEDTHIALDHFSLDLTLTGDIAYVEQFSVRKTHGLQET
jgi:hypothetical protein